MVDIPEHVWKAILDVRDSGVVNMFDRKGVRDELECEKEFEAADWLQDNIDKGSAGRTEWATLITEGPSG